MAIQTQSERTAYEKARRTILKHYPGWKVERFKGQYSITTPGLTGPYVATGDLEWLQVVALESRELNRGQESAVFTEVAR